MSMPGLETLAYSEIRVQMPDAELIKFARGITIFRTASAPTRLLELRTVEDVFVTLVHIKGLGHGPDALKVLHSAVTQAEITKALAVWKRVYGEQPESWRVVSQKSGSHDFRRKDAGQAIESALQKALPRGMRWVKDDADLEIWLWLSGSEALVGLRISDASMRHRRYKQEHLPASLRPTVAAAMNMLARPTAQDIVLDPLCGAGTILIERALQVPYDRLIGGDIRPEALQMARRNARAAEIIVSWREWDARNLPLESASVTRIISNLPFGKQIGSHEENISLYRRLSEEFARVLAPGGIMVTLTSEDRLWDEVLREQGWRISKKLVLVILGQPASIFVAEQAHTEGP
ncbi:MAG TPA: methyltransferase domain-containing protein [Ktedonobacteraceae bacterium]|jgi:23S rRNA G2445 N2-methylase RlmL